MIVNGHIKPFSFDIENDGVKQQRWQMAYQEPGERPVSLCGVQVPDMPMRGNRAQEPPAVCRKEMHITSLQARSCATAVEWEKRLLTQGYGVLQQLREVRAAAEREAMEAAAAELEAARG